MKSLKSKRTNSAFLRAWPRLAALAAQMGPLYVLPDPQKLALDCAGGEISFSGQELAILRLDTALCGLMQDLAEEFFLDEFFVNRPTAAVEILLAARVFLEQEDPEQAEQRERVRLLAAEAENALWQWESQLQLESNRTLLYAAEETEELK